MIDQFTEMAKAAVAVTKSGLSQSRPTDVKCSLKVRPMIDQFTTKTKVAVTIAEMARMLNLSRQRLHQLIGTAFPFPVYNVKTRRPFYTEDLQRVCLEVRRRNCGIDGTPILFYARRGGALSSPIKKPKKAKPNSAHVAILDAVKALGLVSATADQVGSAINILFPRGVESADQHEVIRGVFVHLQRQNRADKVR